MQKIEVLTDNPQERAQVIPFVYDRPCLLAYLAGFFDGDGCFSLYKSQRKEKIYLTPEMSCTGCDEKQIDAVSEIMKHLGYPYYINRRKGWKDNHRSSKDIKVIGIKRCLRVLPGIIPYLRGKKERAELLLWFCNLRKLLKGYSEPYTKVQWAIYDEIHLQNKRGI